MRIEALVRLGLTPSAARRVWAGLPGLPRAKRQQAERLLSALRL